MFCSTPLYPDLVRHLRVAGGFETVSPTAQASTPILLGIYVKREISHKPSIDIYGAWAKFLKLVVELSFVSRTFHQQELLASHRHVGPQVHYCEPPPAGLIDEFPVPGLQQTPP